MNGQISNDQEFLEDDQRVRPSENQPTPIVQNIYPEKEIQTKEVQTKEIQTIHTKEIQTQVNTVVADEGTKARVNQILRQMDSDRPNYSLGQSFNPPDNLGANTLDIGGGSFTVNRHGAITGGSLDIGSGNFTVSAGGDAVVRGNFTVSGSQTLQAPGGSSSRWLCRPLRSSALYGAARHYRVEHFRRHIHSRDSGLWRHGDEPYRGLGNCNVRESFHRLETCRYRYLPASVMSS